MQTTSENRNDRIESNPVVKILFDVQAFAIQDEENETEVITDIIDNEKDSFLKPKGKQTPVRPWSDFSGGTSSSSSNKSSLTRPHRFIKLERALNSAKLLNTDDDRTQFQNEYLNSLKENKFEEFLKKYYKKIDDNYKHNQHEQELKKARMFGFIDLEKNFLSLDPTRDVKIVFIDEPTVTAIESSITTNPHTSSEQNSTSSILLNDSRIEAFYANRSQRLLDNPSQARDEITRFARRAAERLHERLPRLTSLPHRVKIVDERDTTGKPDERAALQMKHKRALSLINKRRHIFIKMVTQAKKNQLKMQQQFKHEPLHIDSSECCRELLEQASEIQHYYKAERISRPKTSMEPRIQYKMPVSSACSNITTLQTLTRTKSPISTVSSIPFRDSLSIDHAERTSNVRVLRSTRPLTAPVKINWINYC